MSNLKILTPARKRAFESIPTLSTNEREGYFIIDVETRKKLNGLKSDVNKVAYLLQQTYFQAKGRFFNANKFKAKDKKYAEKVLNIKTPVDLADYTSQTASVHKQQILKKFNWKAYKASHKKDLYEFSMVLVDKRHSKEVIFFSLLSYCWLHRIEIPGYETFASIVTDSYLKYEEEVVAKLTKNITTEQIEILDKFLSSDSNPFTLRELKKIDQGDTQKSLNKNARLLALYKETYSSIKPLLSAISLSKEAIKHFSDWIYKTNTAQIKQLKNPFERNLRIAAFIEDQYFKRQDYAADAIQKVLRSKVNKARGYERKCKEQNEHEANEANRTVMDSAKTSKQIIKLILEISEDLNLSYPERNERVVQLIKSYFEAENPDLTSHIAKVEKSISKVSVKADYYKYLFANQTSIQRSLGPLIREVVLDVKSTNAHLLDAISNYSSGLSEFDENTNIEFLNESERTLIHDEDGLPSISKYKTLLFVHLANSLKNRSVTIEYSYRYKSTSSYMVEDDNWSNNKDSLLKATSLDRFKDGEKILSEIGAKVTSNYESVNQRIINGENTYFVQKPDNSWRIKNEDANYEVSRYIPKLLNKNTKTLQDMLYEVNIDTEFSQCFTHSSTKHAKTSIDPRLLFATIMSLGTNMGHTAMAKSSRIFSEKNLRDTENHWLSNENIKKANDLIVKTIQSLPLPTVFNDEHGRLHTSSDGKKVVVAVNSLLANYSYKYYGKEQGISVNSFIDEKQSFFHVNVLTASDREAPYMMDGILSSKSIYESEALNKHVHSTDTHGYTEAIFAGLHFLDVSFAPRIKNIHDQTIYAYEAKSTRKKTNAPIAPKTQINKKLILDNWDEILRLMVSIKLEYCSPSQIFIMLSMSEKQNQLYKAIKELGRLIKSNFILNYVNDEELRTSIQKQLNRVELGQKLTDAVFFGRKGKLRVGLEEEIQKVMSCNTLLRNVVIMWNYMFLSDYYYSLEDDETKKDVLDSISNGSVVSWEHINTLGVYEFNHNAGRQFKATLQQMKNIIISGI